MKETRQAKDSSIDSEIEVGPVPTGQQRSPMDCVVITFAEKGSALSQPGFRVGEENGVRYQRPERPKGCFAFLVPAALFRGMLPPELLPVTKHY